MTQDDLITRSLTNYICMNFFPNKVTFPGSRGQDVDTFLRAPFILLCEMREVMSVNT